MSDGSSSQSRMFRYLFVPADTHFLIPTDMKKFKCLILIEREVSREFQWEVSKALVEAGCLFSLAWGIDCTSWDDSVDCAFLEHYDYGEYPEDKFVMTTWHENQTLEETVEFAKTCTDYSEVTLDEILVLDFGTQERAGLIKKLYENI